MLHRISREARGRIGVAVAALNSRNWDVRRRGHASCRGAVVAARAIGVGCRVGEGGARPARRVLVTGRAVGRGGDVTCALALCARRSLAGIGTVVAGAAGYSGDRRVVHRIGREARRRIAVTVAALDPGDGNVRRGLHAGCGGAVVATRAIRVSRCVSESGARKARRALVTS